MPQPHPIHIFINRRRVETLERRFTGAQILALADYGTDYELYRLKGEGDPTGGELIGHDEITELKNGLHFRAIPGNANFGA